MKEYGSISQRLLLQDTCYSTAWCSRYKRIKMVKR